MIVVEGPDGTGKSTLIRQLQDAYPGLKIAPRACTSLAGPLSGNGLVNWLKKYGVMVGYVYDRHPCISGPVYDAVYANPVEGWAGDWVRGAFREILDNARIIYCRPPRREIVKSVNESAQMGGVERNIHRIIDTYDAIMGNMLSHERYDWTRDELPSL